MGKRGFLTFSPYFSGGMKTRFPFEQIFVALVPGRGMIPGYWYDESGNRSQNKAIEKWLCLGIP